MQILGYNNNTIIMVAFTHIHVGTSCCILLLQYQLETMITSLVLSQWFQHVLFY